VEVEMKIRGLMMDRLPICLLSSSRKLPAATSFPSGSAFYEAKRHFSSKLKKVVTPRPMTQ